MATQDNETVPASTTAGVTEDGINEDEEDSIWQPGAIRKRTRSFATSDGDKDFLDNLRMQGANTTEGNESEEEEEAINSGYAKESKASKGMRILRC